MFRLSQIIRNSFLRIEGFFTVVWQFFANLLGNLFSFFARLFGLTSSNYFIEEQAQNTKQTAAKQPITKVQDTSSETSATVSRRPNTNMDYYLNMAREVKKS